MKLNLSIIIVSYNTRQLLVNCLRSIEQYKTQGGRLTIDAIVIDNLSSDGSPDTVRFEFPWVRVIQNNTNLGFAAANNQGIRLSRSDFILLLNSDTELLPPALDEMVRCLETHPAAGMVNAKLIYPSGDLQPAPKNLLTFWRGAVWHTIFWASGLYRALGLSYKKKAFERGRDYDAECDIDWARGACLMIRRECLDDVGLLDENFFFGHEELDYSKRATETGWRKRYVPSAVVVHHGSMSHQPYGKGLGSLINEGMFYYWFKHASLAHDLFLRLTVIAVSGFKLCIRPLQYVLLGFKRSLIANARFDVRQICSALKFGRLYGYPFLKRSSHEYLQEAVAYRSKVLDVGCDRGQLSKPLVADKHCAVTGIEVDATKWKSLPKEFDLILGDVEKPDVLANLKGKYDFVVLGDILEHLR